MRPDPLELDSDDVLSRVCDLLDRKLFESSVAAGSRRSRRPPTASEAPSSALLGVLQRFVDNDLAGVLLLEERSAYVAIAREASQAHYGEFLTAAVDALAAATGTSLTVADLDPRVMDPDENLGADEGRMATFLSMPLRGHGGHVIGVLALSSAAKNAFSETALGTLRLVEDPAAIVIDNARLAVAHTG